MNILGIDPGKTGAFALLDTTTRRVACHDMPDTPQGVVAIIRDLLAPACDFAVLEQLHAGPIMARPTIATMFENYGILRCALMVCNVAAYTTRPNEWKKSLNIPAAKDAARYRAGQFFPDDAEQWKLAKHDGRAEAALIAWYGMRWAK